MTFITALTLTLFSLFTQQSVLQSTLVGNTYNYEEVDTFTQEHEIIDTYTIRVKEIVIMNNALYIGVELVEQNPVTRVYEAYNVQLISLEDFETGTETVHF